MNILLIQYFFLGFVVSEIPRVYVFGKCPTDTVRIRLLSPTTNCNGCIGVVK